MQKECAACRGQKQDGRLGSPGAPSGLRPGAQQPAKRTHARTGCQLHTRTACAHPTAGACTRVRAHSALSHPCRGARTRPPGTPCPWGPAQCAAARPSSPSGCTSSRACSCRACRWLPARLRPPGPWTWSPPDKKRKKQREIACARACVCAHMCALVEGWVGWVGGEGVACLHALGVQAGGWRCLR